MKKKMKVDKIFIGTRGSKLALYQAEWVKSKLQRIHQGIEVEINKIKTTGDKILDVPLAKIGGKGLFVKEIEESLLRGKIHIAVHSMKDMPTDLPEGLHIAAICKREDPRDAFVSRLRNARFEIQNINDLPPGAKVGTSSLRRSCQLLNIRSDLHIMQLRGNLDTRLRKLDEGQFEAIIVAVAGMKRLGFTKRITEILEPRIFLPAIGQGAIGIECRADNEAINAIVETLNHGETSIPIRAERAFLKRLGGGCQVPIAAHAKIEQKARGKEQRLLIMDGLVGSVSGDKIVKGHIEGRPEEAELLGERLAEDLLSRGAKEILEEVYQIS